VTSPSRRAMQNFEHSLLETREDAVHLHQRQQRIEWQFINCYLHFMGRNPFASARRFALQGMVKNTCKTSSIEATRH